MSAYQLLLLLILIVLVAAAVFVILRIQRIRTHPGSSSDHQLIGLGNRDDDRYWYLGGCLYNKPDDPALFVLNRWGIGFTVNVGHPLGTTVAVGILLFLVLVAILPALVPGLNASGYGCHPSSGCHFP
ncbi:MAG: DUF5808 domain-containing protein [Chloroflexota bacterium]